MTQTYVVTGTLTDDTTVKLDQPITGFTGKVRVTVEPVTRASKSTWQDYFADLRARQAARGHVPRSADEIQAQIREERDSWDD